MQRRQFLSAVLGGATMLGTTAARAMAADGLRAGEGVLDITPPLGIELAGFHKPPGQERRVKAIRQPSETRALVLGYGPTQLAICSLDILGVDQPMVERIQRAAAARTGIPAENIHVAATHDHSMPTFVQLRQWGGTSPEFMATVEQRTVEAIVAAQADLAPAELALGKCRALGGSHNRTVKASETHTDTEFGPQSTDAQRWLDTMLHALVFRRAGRKPGTRRARRKLAPTARLRGAPVLIHRPVKACRRGRPHNRPPLPGRARQFFPDRARRRAGLCAGCGPPPTGRPARRPASRP